MLLKTLSILAILLGIYAFTLDSLERAHQQFSETHLGITLMPHFSESLITYGMVTVKDSTITRHDVISEQNFILIASGEMKSDANPNLVNQFEAHAIPYCQVNYKPAFRNYSFSCPLLSSVWRVRYDRHPDTLKEEEEGDGSTVLENVPDSLQGWASDKIHPSEGQMNILKKYGLRTISDVIYGDSLWLFLKDISNPVWVEKYRAN